MIRDRIEVLDWIRGLAAFAVAWFHFTYGVSGWIQTTGAYGRLGVEVFFVISGLVIPFAMHSGGYCGWRDAGTFMFKRLARLEPPYLASLLLTIAVLYLPWLMGLHGEKPSLSLTRVLLHIGYLNVFFTRDWLNPVYWTLAVELQFYLSMLLLFPALSQAGAPPRLMALALMAWLPLTVPDRGLIFPYLGLFALGAVAFQHRAALISRSAAVSLGIGLSAVNLLALGPAEAGVGLAAAAVAAFANVPRIRPLALLGSISYSLYLTHVPVGGTVLSLSRRLPDGWSGLGIPLAVAASLVAAYGLYWFVERPAQKLSSRIRYPERPFQPAVLRRA
ncbi:MAG: acyltransferase [Phenylobacterium sp.]